MKSVILPIVLLALFLSQCGPQSKTELWEPEILKDFLANGKDCILPDYSYAGYGYDGITKPHPIVTTEYDVTDFGAVPNDGVEDSKAIQIAIDNIGKNGGGILNFPKGRFLVNMDSNILNNIQINYSNVVLRGSGSDTTGTIIFTGSSTHHQQDTTPYLSQFVFHSGLNLFGTDRFYTVDEEPEFARLTADFKKGESIIALKKTEGLKAGEFLIIAMKNTTTDGNLTKELMNPLDFEPFQTSYSEAGKISAPSFQWMVEIEQVIDEQRVKLKQPSRRDILTKFDAFVVNVPMLKNIGVENMRFECAYQGGYKHHLSPEHDYGWGAVCLHRVAHGWIKNLHIHNYTQTTHLVNSRNVSISDITITG
ncbi:glycoside hydrolase family 55 protein, partial [Bacteroidales bacterium]|nr:glycoside hydrolase family 55 protein [Bacteroidales bacterium]